MAYETGSGATTQDFLNALQTFAATQGWTINKWDTANKLLYLSKGICKVCLEWHSININVFTGVTSSVFAEGWIRGTLVATMGASNDWSTLAGSGIISGQRLSTAARPVRAGDIGGPFTSWHFFAGDTYIHCALQTAADRWNHIGFGVLDAGGMTHGGVAYLHADAGKEWFKSSNSATVGLNVGIQYNKPAYAGSLFAGGSSSFTNQSTTRISGSSIGLLSVDALPTGSNFVNNVCSFAGNSGSAGATAQRALGVRTRNETYLGPDNYRGAGVIMGMRLCDPLIANISPGYTQFVPMMGIPLGFVNTLSTQACMVGSVPDCRLLNMSSLSPQQELDLAGDTWKIFPQCRQAAWADSGTVANASSGQFAIAYKKFS